MSYAPLDDGEVKHNSGNSVYNNFLASNSSAATAISAAASTAVNNSTGSRRDDGGRRGAVLLDHQEKTVREDEDHPLRPMEHQQQFLSSSSSLPNGSTADAAAAVFATDQPQRMTHNNNNNKNNVDDDPFYVFREDLYRQLERVDECLAEYLRVVQQTDSAVYTHELKDAKKQLKRWLKTAESTWQDVQMTVQLVESDRTKFSRIVDDKEFYERSALVRTSRDRLERAKAELQSPAVLAKLRQDERAKAMRRATTDAAAASAVTMTEQNQQHQQNAAASDSLAARQSLLMQHQDDTLDELSLAVTRVNFMADSIHEEIGQQNKMLTTMEEDLTNVEEELGMVMGKLAKFLKTKDSWQLGTIVCLLATTIVLFFFLVYV